MSMARVGIVTVLAYQIGTKKSGLATPPSLRLVCRTLAVDLCNYELSLVIKTIGSIHQYREYSGWYQHGWTISWWNSYYKYMYYDKGFRRLKITRNEVIVDGVLRAKCNDVKCRVRFNRGPVLVDRIAFNYEIEMRGSTYTIGLEWIKRWPDTALELLYEVLEIPMIRKITCKMRTTP